MWSWNCTRGIEMMAERRVWLWFQNCKRFWGTVYWFPGFRYVSHNNVVQSCGADRFAAPVWLIWQSLPWMFHVHVHVYMCMCICVYVKLSDAKQKLDLAEFQNTSKCSGKMQYVISGSIPKPFVQCYFCHFIHLYWGDKIYAPLYIHLWRDNNTRGELTGLLRSARSQIQSGTKWNFTITVMVHGNDSGRQEEEPQTK